MVRFGPEGRDKINSRGVRAIEATMQQKGTSNNPVVPAGPAPACFKVGAGTQSVQVLENTMDWIPAYAGMTNF